VLHLPAAGLPGIGQMGKIVRGMVFGINRIAWFSEILAEFALACTVILVFHEVVVRYIFNSPTIFSVEISEYLVVFLLFASVGWILKEERHVRVEAFITLLPEKVQHLLDILTSLLVMILCGVLIWKGGQTVITAYRGDYHSSSLLNVPLWIPYAFVPFGSLILGLQYIVRIGDRTRKLFLAETRK